MCDYCKEVLGSCITYHESHKCPLKRSSFCLNCHNYGHTKIECVESKEFIELEQLIPSKLLKECGIETHTPLVRSSSVGVYEKNILPELIEELIPEFYLKQYKISSKTPLVCSKKMYETTPNNPVLDITDHPKVIRDFLKACNNMPKKQDRSKDKYKNHLNKVATKAGYSIEYIQNLTPEQNDSL
jgi:hypothetical protein